MRAGRALAVARLHAELDAALELPVWSMTQAVSAHPLIEVPRLANRTAALELRVATQAVESRVEELTGASSTANWWAVATRITRTEAHLVELAGEHDAKDLRRLGKGILTVLAPRSGRPTTPPPSSAREAHEAARFTMVDDGHGKVHGRFTLATRHGAMLKKALLAFAELIENLCATTVPSAGGADATVVVTMNLESLLGGLKPAVLDTKDQRIATALRDGGCTAEGCDWPPGLCHAHHQARWTDGGNTTVDDGRLLCPRHAVPRWARSGR